MVFSYFPQISAIHKSLYYFKDIGFIIIPIATTISSWFNSIILLIFLKNKKLFNFNDIFWKKFFKISFASLAMGIFFNYLTILFENQLSFDYQFKSLYLIFSVFLGLVFYLLLCFFIKAFNYKDLKLKY